MNKIFKVVWSKVRNSYVVVSEVAKANGKSSVKSIAAAAAVAAMLSGGMMTADAASGNLSSEINAGVISGTGTLTVTVGPASQAGLQTGNSSGTLAETVTINGYDAIVLDGSHNTHANVFNAYKDTTITIDTGAISTADTADLSNSTVFHAQYGDVDITATDITLDNVGNGFMAQQGGNLTVDADDIKVNAVYNALQSGYSNDVGSISITADNLELISTDSAGISSMGGTVDIDVDGKVVIEGSNAVNANYGGEVNVSADEIYVTENNNDARNALRAAGGATLSIEPVGKAVIDGNVLAEGSGSALSLDLGTGGSLTGKITTTTGNTTNLDFGTDSVWNVTGVSNVTKTEGEGTLVIAESLLTQSDVVTIGTNDSNLTVKAAGIDLSGGAKQALANVGSQLSNTVSVEKGSAVTFANATTDAALYGDVTLNADGTVTTEIDTDHLNVDGTVTAGKLVTNNGLKVQTSGAGSFSFANIGTGETLFYAMSTDTSKTNPTIVMNAQNGNIETQGSLSVGNGAFVSDVTSGNAAVKGSLDVGGDANVTGGVNVGTNVIAADDVKADGGNISLKDTANKVAVQGTKIEALENASAAQSGKITALENSDAQQNGKISALEGLTSQHTDKISALEDLTSQHTDKITALENSEAQQNDKISALEGLTSQHTDKITALENSDTQQNDKISALEGLTSEHSTKIDALEGAASQQSGKITALEDLTAQHTDKIGALENSDAQQNGKITALENDSVEQSGKITALEGLTSQHTDKITALENDSREQSGKITALEDTAAAHGTAIATNTANIEKNTTDIATNTANIAANTTAIGENRNAIAGLNSRLGSLDNRLDKVGAGAAALAALHPLDYDPEDKLSFSAGVGNYAGETAAAVGAFYRPNEDVMFSIGGTAGNGENMVNAGVSFAIGKGSSGTAALSKAELVQEVNAVKAENEALKEENKDIRNELNQLKAMIMELAAKK